MYRLANVIHALLVACFISTTTSIAQEPIENDDSLRNEIAQLHELSRQLREQNTRDTFDSSFVLLDSAASIVIDHFGDQDTLYVITLFLYTGNCFELALWDRALSYANKALAVVETSHEDNRSLRIRALSWMETIYCQATDFVNCTKVCKELIDIINESEVESDYETEVLADCMGSLILARLQQGDYSEELLEDSEMRLQLISEQYGEDSWRYAKAVAGVGYHLKFMKRPKEAAVYTLKGDSLIKGTFPPENHTSLWSSVMVVEHYLARGDFDAVDSILRMEFEIIDRTLGDKHPYLPLVMARQAQLLIALDSLDRAIEVFQQVGQIYREQSNFPTMMLLMSLEWLGYAAFVAEDHELYNQATRELVDIKQTYLFRAFRYASETLKLSLVRRYPMIESKLFSGVVKNPHPDMVNAAAEMSLNGKGLAFDAMATQQSAAMCAGEPSIDSLLAEHNRIANRIAGTVLSSRGGSDDQLDSLFAGKDRLEEEISEICSELNLSQNEERYTATDIFGALPNNSILLDFVTYESYDYEEYYPYPHDSMYSVVTYTSDGQLSIVDIGKMAVIDSLVMEYQSVMTSATESFVLGEGKLSWEKYKRVAAVLYDRLIAPVSDLLENREQVFVAPDGMVNLLPFETLTPDGLRFLIEDHQFSYLTSGRDLFKQETESGSNDVIVMADPDFMTDPSMLPLLATQEPSDFFAFRGSSDSPQCLTIMYSPLPKTASEASSVVGLFERTGISEVSYFKGMEAREGILKQIKEPPRILHIASHGYFCDQSDLSNFTNPLLRSGLILAGANSTIGGMSEIDSKNEDGILTALETSGLNLIGTELVVLSACQTGIGEVQSSEGVFGLRRAFQHAGARSLITSMFAVPDESTSMLMERFYENWLSGDSKSSALRNASLSILKERRETAGATHPLFWGGFILVGDPN